MLSQAEIQAMPKDEKLRLLDAIWDDLSHPEADFVSPDWHADALAATPDATPLDWEAAKAKLRARQDDL